MNIRTVAASNGIQWLTDSVQLILKNPAPFALMGLVVAVAGAIPILGSFALAAVGPALYGGIAWAAREQAQGRSAQFDHLARAFQQDGKIGPMLLLCLPGLVAGLAIGILVVGVVALMMAGAGMTAVTGSDAAVLSSLGVGGVLLLVLVLAVGLLVFALTFFAIPDLMFSHNDAFGAMKQSFKACMSNPGAVLLYVLVLLVAAVVVAVLLSVVSSILAQFLVSIVLVPLIGTSSYIAWKDVYGEVAADVPPPPPADGGGMVA
ncbi:MAG TPA: BPSS1780 family membrane protein [Chiayiivirga sp.]|nr:BPSS1780 family membrane protein [Chiayiivirga sp.]